MHVVADCKLSVSVVEPGGHSAHGVMERELNRPAAHAMHADAPSSASQLPEPDSESTAKSKREVQEPSTADTVFVTDPDGHTTHTDDGVALYCPSSHLLHVDAPTDPSVSVTAPAGHPLHASVDSAVKVPTAQGVHVKPPSPASASVTDPAGHTEQLVWPLLS